MSENYIMLTISSQLANVGKLEQFVQQIVSQHQLDAEMYGNILISLTEAVTNAIVHGNNRDETKSVEISCRRNENKIAIKVSDEGIGFNPNELSDPTKEENIAKIGGRGVFLMKELCDSISFSNNGSTVQLLFYLG